MKNSKKSKHKRTLKLCKKAVKRRDPELLDPILAHFEKYILELADMLMGTINPPSDIVQAKGIYMDETSFLEEHALVFGCVYCETKKGISVKELLPHTVCQTFLVIFSDLCPPLPEMAGRWVTFGTTFSHYLFTPISA